MPSAVMSSMPRRRSTSRSNERRKATIIPWSRATSRIRAQASMSTCPSAVSSPMATECAPAFALASISRSASSRIRGVVVKAATSSAALLFALRGRIMLTRLVRAGSMRSLAAAISAAVGVQPSLDRSSHSSSRSAKGAARMAASMVSSGTSSVRVMRRWRERD